MAFEGLNTAGDFKKDMLVILNDNQMSISQTVGAFSKYLHRLLTNPTYNALRSSAKEIVKRIAPEVKPVAKQIEAALKPGTLFEEFGFRYFGPLDGNDLDALLPVLDILSLKRIQRAFTASVASLTLKPVSHSFPSQPFRHILAFSAAH